MQHPRTSTAAPAHRARPTRSTRRGGRLAAFAASLAAVVALTTLGGTAAHGADNPYERGPAPTAASIEALRGPYAVSETTVSRLSVTGFGGGTIYYPTSTADGTFGAIAVSPGCTGTQSSIAWLGERLASQGFVVFTIDTLTTLDHRLERRAVARGARLPHPEQLRPRPRRQHTPRGHGPLDGRRQPGGREGPALAAGGDPADAVEPRQDLAGGQHPHPDLRRRRRHDRPPWPTHAEPFYSSLPASLDRAYLELNGATHFTPNTSNTTIAKYSIAWLKRFIGNDTRYEQFLCPLPRPSLTIEEYRGNCPHTS